MPIKKLFVASAVLSLLASAAALYGVLSNNAGKALPVAASAIAFLCLASVFIAGYIGLIHMAKEKEAGRVKSRFLAKMSHEIRTPMNGIIGLNELFPRDNLNEEQNRNLNDTSKLAHGLLNILNDILDFSKIEAGTFELNPENYNIYGLFDDVCSVQAFLALGKSVSFQTRRDSNIPEILYGDAARVRQIFINLTNNAVKYTREGSIQFSLMRGDYEGDKKDYLICVVDDTGIGIKKDQLASLFDPSNMLNRGLTLGVEGTGLGLMIAKNIIDMMSGHILVESVFGEGSKFSVYIPLVEGDPAQVKKGRPPIVMSKGGVNVLVVDDMSTNLTVASGFLLKHGIKAGIALSGIEAINLVREKFLTEGVIYDLILMDHMMPGMDGLETAVSIRNLGRELAEPLLSAIPVIILSANAVAEARAMFLASGMNDFLAKPLDGNELNAALTRWLPSEKVRFDSRDAAGIDAENKKHRDVVNVLDGLTVGGVDGALDSGVGVYYAGGNWNSYIAVLKSFTQELNSHLELLRAAFTSKNYASYAIEAHAYKGLLASIGFSAFSEWGKRLEMAAKAADKAVSENAADAAGKTAVITADETEAFCAALEELKGKLIASDIFEQQTVKEDVSADELMETLLKLEKALDRSSISRVKEAAKRLSHLNIRHAILDKNAVVWETKIDEIVNFCEVMRYDEALRMLRLLIETEGS